MWRNTRTGIIYSEMLSPIGPSGFVWMRSARKQKMTRVLGAHLEEYEPDAGLAFEDELVPAATIEDPQAGEPAADPGEPDHVDLLEPAEPVVDRPELLRRMAQEGQADGLHDLRPDEVRREPAPSDVRLPPVHGDLRSLTYNVGSAIAVLLENPGSEGNLRVAILMLGDEIERIRG